jgi:hypothetical protein
MPALSPEEIIISDNKLPATPKESILFEFGTGTLRQKYNSNDFLMELRNNGELRIVFADKQGLLKVCLLDLSGRMVHMWAPVTMTGNSITLKVDNKLSGMFIVQIQDGARVLKQKVFIR